MVKKILCANNYSLRQAINAMEFASVIVLDCEGENLGHRGGSLSLISLRALAPQSSEIYLIDIISLTNDALQPLFNIIKSPSSTKIVFDGRMDYTEFYHGHNITMSGVIDLQLADVISRRQRRESDQKRLERLSSYLPRSEVFGNRHCYAAVERLSGLEACLRDHGVIEKYQTVKEPGENTYPKSDER
jgi:exonuclease 3'-5' domain-containing protein 1